MMTMMMMTIPSILDEEIPGTIYIHSKGMRLNASSLILLCPISVMNERKTNCQQLLKGITKESWCRSGVGKHFFVKGQIVNILGSAGQEANSVIFM
jgi:hypothetical protein